MGCHHVDPLELSDYTTSLKGQPVWRPRAQTASDSLGSSHSFCDPELPPQFLCLSFPI